jgi:hypothetical protein
MQLQPSQLERLKKDSKELGHYIHKLNKRGKEDLAHKIGVRRERLNQHISQIQ